MRRTFKRLQKEGQVGDKVKILFRAGEKLATDIELLRHENRGLRNAIVHEKKKRKRGKAMHFLDEGEMENQAMFFSPAKIARVRQRNKELEKAEQQRKQTANDKKLQRAITRVKKAREAEQKRIALPEARAKAKEEKLRAKTERQAERELQRQRKAEEAIQRKLIAEEIKRQNREVKKSRTKAVNPKKRRREEKEVVKPRKRLRSEPMHPRNQPKARVSTVELNSTAIQLQDNGNTSRTRGCYGGCGPRGPPNGSAKSYTAS